MSKAFDSLPEPSFRVLSEHAAQALKRSILAGRFKPGDRLVERDLAEELNISRAPVRDALRLLAKEGLITLIPHRGAVITKVSPELVVDAFSVRGLLEGMATRLAVPRLTAENVQQLQEITARMEQNGREGDAGRLVDLDIEFHRVLTSTCNRPILLEALSAISSKTYLLIATSRYAFPLDRIADLHAWILDAVISGDADRVEAAVRDHIAFGQQTLLRYLTSSNPNDYPMTSRAVPATIVGQELIRSD